VQGRVPLNRESITAAALALIGELGLDGFSMRRLAQRLNVQSPALYWHFRSREELMGQIAEVIIMGTGMGPPGDDESWQEWMRRRALVYRQALLEQRDGARIVAGARGASVGMVHLFNEEIAALTRFGFTPLLAMQSIAVMTHFVSGFVLKEQTESEASGREQDGGAAAMQTFLTVASPAVLEAFAAGANPLSEQVFTAGVDAIIAGTSLEIRKGQ
jgi:TetR/AcrR family tetracycline transcriptional repressor